MVVLIVRSFSTMVLGLADVEFASEDRLDALCLGGIEEMYGAVDVAMIGHGDGPLAKRSHAIDELVDVAGAVEKRVFRVKMEMSEFSHGPVSILRAVKMRAIS
jgi:hypothetical protein